MFTPLTKRPRWLAIFVTALVAAFIPTTAEENQKQQPLTLTYPRAQHSPTRSAKPPEPDPAPGSLLIEQKKVPPPSRVVRHVDRVVRQHLPRRIPRGWAQQAEEAAAWTADRLAATWGFRGAYQWGFHEAIHAIRQQGGHEFRAEFNAGRREGRRNRQIQQQGRRVGREDATALARDMANQAILEEFTDLERRPLRSPIVPHPTTPDYRGSAHFAAPPQLETIAAELGPSDFGLPVDETRWPDGQADPLPLFQSTPGHGPRDRNTIKPAKAFDYWCRLPQGRKTWRDLPKQARREFRSIFEAHFPTELEKKWNPARRNGYRSGWHEGWVYADRIYSELHFREGFHAGSQEAWSQSAGRAFNRSFPRAYLGQYDALFDEWYFNPKPQIQEVHLSDKNGDGVFEPGEAFKITAKIANFGGREGRFGLDFQSEAMERMLRRPLVLPNREVSLVEVGRGRIRPSFPAKTTAVFNLDLGSTSFHVQQLIAYPLQWGNTVEILDRDNIDGRISLAMTLTNISDRRVGKINVRFGDDQRQVRRMNPGEQRRLHFETRNLDPLALMAGEVRLDYAAYVGNERHDSGIYTPVSIAADLSSRDLLIYMLDLARDPAAFPHANRQIRQVQQLMLTRLRADWKAAIRQRGNPYKHDRRNGDRTTALGDLVATYKAHRHEMRRPHVFTELTPSLERLARELPGTHPFLRKQFRGLVRELG
ncbi:hypothetical protein [Sulfidibacter corallicola]|uniref:Uncharacterized protein n=1 Tax=Sulfidibacter corallicola TaxID=2818388 RepID=A0A8A4TSS6_SULCO|nr:hypothetical protein [Sulfidibacter corallicola]QTD52553.1 hypothetical protein J3U87_08775 [Sulfidibacter corallicola]